MQQVLEGCDGVRNIHDDIIVHGQSTEEHDKRLEEAMHGENPDQRPNDEQFKRSANPKCLTLTSCFTYFPHEGWDHPRRKLKQSQKPDKQGQQQKCIASWA